MMHVGRLKLGCASATLTIGMSKWWGFEYAQVVSSIKSSTTLQATLVGAAVAGLGLSLYLWPYLKIGASVFKGWALSFVQGTPEQRLLEHVRSNAKQGDAEDVLKTIDEWCWRSQWMMNIGNLKGQVLDQAVNNAKPKIAVELGGYVGYSAIRIARLMPPGSKFYTIELNAEFAAIAREMIKFAGLEDRCKIFVGESAEVLKTLKDKISADHVDLFFIDHWKTLYLRDLKLIESLGLLQKGSVLVADNVIFPGAPDYLKYVRSSSSYQSSFHKATVEYSEVPDGVEVTTVQ